MRVTTESRVTNHESLGRRFTLHERRFTSFGILSASSAPSAVRSSPPASRFTNDASRVFLSTDYRILTTGRYGGHSLTSCFHHQAVARRAQQVGIERVHLLYSDRIPTVREPDTVGTRSAQRAYSGPTSHIRHQTSSGPAQRACPQCGMSERQKNVGCGNEWGKKEAHYAL